MRIKTFTILAFIAGLLGSLYADLGYTSEQAAAKFGKPSGFLNNGSSIICIYETAHGRITEVYNEYDICIESDADRVLPEVLQGPPPVEEVSVVEEEPDTAEEELEIVEEEPVVQEQAPVQALPSEKSVHSPFPSKPDVKSQVTSELESESPPRRINIFQLKIVLLFALSFICIILALVMRVEQQEARERRVAKKLAALRNAMEQNEKPGPAGARDAKVSDEAMSDLDGQKQKGKVSPVGAP